MSSIGTIGSALFQGIERDFIKDCVITVCTTVATPIVASQIMGATQDDPTVKILVSVFFATIALIIGAAFVIYRQRRRRHKTRRASGKKVAVYITQLQGDDDAGNHRAVLIDSLRAQIGSDLLEIIPEGELPLADRDSSNDDAVAPRVEAKARDMLKENGGSLYIWGRVFTIGNTSSLALRFVSLSAEHDGMDRQVFNITPDNKLEEKLAPVVIKSLSMIVLSKIIPVINDGDIDTQMKSVENFVRPLAMTPPANLPLSETTQIRSIYAYYLYKRALKEKDLKLLDDAAQIYRMPITTPSDGKSDRLDRGMAYFGLGNVLTARGEWKEGLLAFSTAIQCYKTAVQILTLKEHPLEFQALHYAMGMAYWARARMANGVPDLIEAAACFRVASGDLTSDKEINLAEKRQETLYKWQDAERNLGLVAVEMRYKGAHWDVHNMDEYMQQVSMRWNLRNMANLAGKADIEKDTTLAEKIDNAHAALWASAMWIGTEQEAERSRSLLGALMFALNGFKEASPAQRKPLMRETLLMLDMLSRKAKYYPEERDIARAFYELCIETLDDQNCPLEVLQFYLGLMGLHETVQDEKDIHAVVEGYAPYITEALQYATRDMTPLFLAEILEKQSTVEYQRWETTKNPSHLIKCCEYASAALNDITFEQYPNLYRSAHFWKAGALWVLLRDMPETHPDYLKLNIEAAHDYEAAITGVMNKNDPTYVSIQEKIGTLYSCVGEKIDDVALLRRSAQAFEQALAYTDKDKNVKEWERYNFLIGQIYYIISEIDIRVDRICEPRTILKMIDGLQAYLDTHSTDKVESLVVFAREWTDKARGLLEGFGLTGDPASWPERVHLDERAA